MLSTPSSVTFQICSHLRWQSYKYNPFSCPIDLGSYEQSTDNSHVPSALPALRWPFVESYSRLELSLTSLRSSLNLFCHLKTRVSDIVISPYTYWTISTACNWVFSNNNKSFMLICSLVFMAEQKKGNVSKSMCKKKMQWLQKVKITIIYSLDIMLMII